MRHEKVIWHHDNPDEPIVLCSEVDDDGWERRKVDECRDGRLDRADAESEAGTTRLADQVMPSLEEINAQGPFEAATISSDEFEALWLRAAPR